MKRLFAAIGILCLLSPAVWADDPRVITTTGSGVVDAVPDMAMISLGVTQEAAEAGAAMQAASEAVRAILDRLEAAGVAPRDVQTDNLSLQPVWLRTNDNATPPRITGFVARNSLNIRVRDLDLLGSVLDQVVQDGANTFNGLRFSLDDADPLVAEARAAAVQDAVTKAQQLAEAAGVSLGPILSISEQSGGPRPVMMEMASARMASDVPVAAGEVSLSAQVTIVFEIAD